MKKAGNIALWIVSAIFLIFLFVTHGILPKILLALAIICLIPVSPVRKWMKSGSFGKFGGISATMIAVLLLICAILNDAGSADTTRSVVLEDAPASAVESVIEETPALSVEPSPTPEPSEEPTPEPTPEATPTPPVREAGADQADAFDAEKEQKTTELVLNTSSMKIHHPSCPSVEKIAPENYETTTKSVEELEAEGYTKCGQPGDWN